MIRVNGEHWQAESKAIARIEVWKEGTREEAGTFGGFKVGGFGLVKKSGCRE